MHLNKLHRSIMLILVMLVSTLLGSGTDWDDFITKYTWGLESYNDWNLPFAKTVEIRSNPDWTKYGTSYTHDLQAWTYTMQVDSSALFSVLFLTADEFTDY